MAAKPKTKTAASNLPIPQDDTEARAAIREIGDLKRQIARREADLNDQISAMQEAAGNDVEPLRQRLTALTDGLQMFCDVNRDRLTQGGKVKTYQFATGVVSWRLRPARVTIRKVEDVIAAIKGLRLANRFLRVKEEVNKEAMLADPVTASGIAGVSIGSAGEDFIVEPFETELPEGGV